MKMLQAIIVILGIMLMGFIGYYAYLGGFKQLKVDIKEDLGPYYVISKKHVGDYRAIDKVIEEVVMALEKNEAKISATMGIYYDDPREVDKEQLQSEGGCLVDKATYEVLAALQSQRLDDSFIFKTIKPQSYFHTEFVPKNKFSMFIGIMKAYGSMQKTIENKAGVERPAYSLEIYHMKDLKRQESKGLPFVKTTYLMPYKLLDEKAEIESEPQKDTQK